MSDLGQVLVDGASFAELDEVLSAASRLPLCDRAAKLHALVARVIAEARSGSNIAPACDALAAAATASLADDPWVQFETAVRQLQACSSGTTSPSRPEPLAAPNTPGPVALDS